MTTSVQFTGSRAASEIRFDSPTRFQPTPADNGLDSSGASTESDFHKFFKQGSLFADDEDETAAGDSAGNTGASRDQGNSGPDSGYLASSAINIARSRPAMRVDADTAQATGNSTNLLSPGAMLPPTRSGSVPNLPAIRQWSAGSVSAPPEQSTIGSATYGSDSSYVLSSSIAVASSRPGIRVDEPTDAASAQTNTSTSDSRQTGNSTNVLPSGMTMERWSAEPTTAGSSTRKDGSEPMHSSGQNRVDANEESDQSASDTPSKRNPRNTATATTRLSAWTSGTTRFQASATSEITTPGDPENGNPAETRSQSATAQAPDPADLLALLSNTGDDAQTEKAGLPALTDVVSQITDASAPEMTRAGSRPVSNTSPQPAPPPNPNLTPTPESLSLSPAPAAAEDSDSDATSPVNPANRQKSGQANAPTEWTVDNDDSRVGAAGSTSSDPVAFEAKLTPEPVAPGAVVPTLNVAPSAPPAASRTIEATSDEVNGAPELKPETLFKTEMPAPISSAPLQPEARQAAAAQPDAPVATQMQPMIEAPATPSGQAVTVNVRESADDVGVNLRFVERNGEIHVSVRTSDAQLAQDMRGGLSDLAGRLEHAGIRTEISNLSSGEPNTQRDAQQPPAEHKGSGRRPQDAQREQQESRKNNPSGWLEAMQDSTGENAHLNQEQNT
jgi:hypothetical protein